MGSAARGVIFISCKILWYKWKQFQKIVIWWKLTKAHGNFTRRESVRIAGFETGTAGDYLDKLFFQSTILPSSLSSYLAVKHICSLYIYICRSCDESIRVRRSFDPSSPYPQSPEVSRLTTHFLLSCSVDSDPPINPSFENTPFH